MLPQLPYPELINRDTHVPEIRHIVSPDGPHKFWCGLTRDPSRPVRWIPKGTADCVVCESLRQELGCWWQREDSWL